MKCRLSYLPILILGLFVQDLMAKTLMQSEIKHVVVLMLENRSFDNVLGWLYEQDAPLEFIPQSENASYNGLTDEMLTQFENVLKNSKGKVVFSSFPIKGTPSVSSTVFLNSPKFDPNEPFANVTTQIYNGGTAATMTGFIQDYASQWYENEWLDQKQEICAVMETYTPQQLPVLTTLAKHYAVSDLWFSSVPTQTNPNRAFNLCGTSEGEIDNGPLGKNDFHADTVWNRLYEQSPETTWTIFWQGDMLPGIFSGPYSGTNTFANLNKIPNLETHFQKLDAFHILARNGQLPDISFLEPQWTISINFSPKDMASTDFIFRSQDFILGLQGNDIHPPGDVRPAENLLANVYTSLIANQEAWNQTLFVILFDEHGGIFDHIPPPAAIPPDSANQNGFDFDRYGVRVPAIFISPKINQSVVVRSDNPNTPFDHTSLISTLLTWKGVDKTTWNMGARVNVAPTFDSVVERTDPRIDAVIGDDSSNANEDAVVYMGEAFYLKDPSGNYIVASEKSDYPYIGSGANKTAFVFDGGSGQITHGSFVMIKPQDPSFGNENLLETSLRSYDCYCAQDKHCSNQWWTIKSMDHPFLGSAIQDGDRVYLENHIYLDLIQYVPGRLSTQIDLFKVYLTTKSITTPGSDGNYWILEKKDEG